MILREISPGSFSEILKQLSPLVGFVLAREAQARFYVASDPASAREGMTEIEDQLNQMSDWERAQAEGYLEGLAVIAAGGS